MSKIKVKAPEQREEAAGPLAPTASNLRQEWASWCSALIDAGATSRFAYARAFMARSRHGKDPAVIRFFAQGVRKDPKVSTLAQWDQIADDLVGNRKNNPLALAKLGLALAWGEEMHRRLYRLYPGHKNALALSRDALGESLPRIERKARWRATVAECVELLPPRPGNGTSERERRAGITDEQRMANAETAWG